MQEGIWTTDKDSNTTFVNPLMAEILGYNVEEMLGKPIFSFMDERGVEIAKIGIDHGKQNITKRMDFELIRKDGNRIYTTLAATPMTDEKGNYVGSLAGVTDITERKRTEEALNESEVLYRTLFEDATDGMALADAETGILADCNQSLCQMVEWDKAELV